MSHGSRLRSVVAVHVGKSHRMNAELQTKTPCACSSFRVDSLAPAHLALSGCPLCSLRLLPQLGGSGAAALAGYGITEERHPNRFKQRFPYAIYYYFFRNC